MPTLELPQLFTAPDTRRPLWERMRCGFASAALALLAGCASLERDETTQAERIQNSAWAQANELPMAEPTARWRHQRIASRAATHYSPVAFHGRPAMQAHSVRGDSVLRLPLKADTVPPGYLHFAWFVKALNTTANLQDATHDDAVVRVILYFDGDRSQLSPRDQRLSEWIQLATGEPLPYASLVYVWDHHHPVDAVLKHPRTDRIRSLVAESGADRLGRWVDIQRDVRADYERAFGHPPGALIGIALMTDANNTQQVSRAWYGPLRWLERSTAP